MKCDELKRKYSDITGPYYGYNEVNEAIAELKQFAEDACLERDDNQNAIDELQAENAELKKKLMPCLNGDCILTCEVVEKYGKENAELKQKLEDAKASHYAENVDFEMTNKKLHDELTKLKAQMPEYKKYIEEEEFRKKLVDEYAGYVYDWKGRHYIATPYLNIFIKGILRALWLYRATTAKHLVTAYENYDYLDCQEMTIKQENARTWMTCKLRTAEEWVKVWKNVERKCRAKAEQYK